MKKFLLTLVISSWSLLLADTITVKNKSDFDLYAGIYYYQKNADLASDVKLIAPKQEVTFERPPSKGLPVVGPKRFLAFSYNKGDLKPQVTSSDFHLIGNTTIGTEQGTTFYLDLDRGAFKGYNILEWKVIEPLKEKLGGVVNAIDDLTLGMIRRKYTDNPLANIPVSVRQGTSLPDQELAYLQLRKPKVRAKLEQLLGMKIEDKDMPTMAVCLSGGGYRAMLGSTGSIWGMGDLLNAFTYMSGLSGGSWFEGPWVTSGLTPAEFAAQLPAKITRDFISAPSDYAHLIQNLMMRLAFKQPISPVNIYGRLLAVNIMSGFKNGPFNIYLHDQTDRIKDGNWVFPIYTAVATKLPYQWVEFTPYEMGGDYFGGYIPMWAMGSPFLNGQRQYYTPPFALSYILAITGSAFAARLTQSFAEISKKIPVEPIKTALSAGMEELEIGRFRIAAAKVFNWTYGMRPLPRAQQETMSLIDGGIAYNLGLEALLRRKSNIIVVLDYSANKEVGGELKKAEADLRGRGFKLPPIDYTGIENKIVSVFKDPTNPEVPVIIYMPQIKNELLDPRVCLANWCGTFELSYPLDKSNLLINHSKKNMEAALPTLMNEIKQWISARQGPTASQFTGKTATMMAAPSLQGTGVVPPVIRNDAQAEQARRKELELKYGSKRASVMP